MTSKPSLLRGVLRILSWFLDLLFPQKCVVCDELLLEGGELCPDCLDAWKTARLSRCPLCRKTARACKCRTFHAAFTDSFNERSIISLAFYPKPDSDDMADTAVRQIVRAVKTSTNKSAVRMVSRELSRLILKAILREGDKPESYKITFPPRSKSRVRAYGFDHGRDIARYISKYTGIPFQNTLKNIGKTAQKELNSLERKLNADASYKLKHNACISGKYILVDDIITTGATVNAAAKLLKEAGAAAVYPVSIARTKKKKRKVRRPAQNPWFRSV